MYTWYMISFVRVCTEINGFVTYPSICVARNRVRWKRKTVPIPLKNEIPVGLVGGYQHVARKNPVYNRCYHPMVPKLMEIDEILG